LQREEVVNIWIDEVLMMILMINCSGYMSPEYAMQGVFSVKSDVYSFRVQLLEIDSGEKNSTYDHTNSLSVSSPM